MDETAQEGRVLSRATRTGLLLVAIGALFLAGVAAIVLHEEPDGARRGDAPTTPTTSVAAPSPGAGAAEGTTTLAPGPTAPGAGTTATTTVAAPPAARAGGTTAPTAPPTGAATTGDDDRAPTLANTGAASPAPAALALLALAAALHALRPRRARS